ncbi:hypothetical protein Tco_1425250 [Tanacetum coccineum]
MFTKHFIGGRGGSIVGRDGSIVGRGGGLLAKRSMVSKDGLGGGGFVVLECLNGWVRAGEGEVKGGGVVFEVSKNLLGEIPGVFIGESSGETFRVDGGAD